MPSKTTTAQIRALNDELRQHLTGGRALITPGSAALGSAAVARIVKTIAVFDDFCQANDPYGEHDFGAFEADGHTIFFKIDYLDSTLTFHSPDPADPAATGFPVEWVEQKAVLHSGYFCTEPPVGCYYTKPHNE